MIYYSHGLNIGQLSWGWIKPKDEAIHIPAQIKFMGLLPYQGFKYVLPDEFWEIVRDGAGDYIKTEKGMLESTHDAIFADSKNELIDQKINKYKKVIEDLNMEIKGWEKIKELP